MTASRFRALRFALPDFDRGGERPGLQLSLQGRFALVDNEASIRQALLLLLSTSPGERVMRPDYGCDLQRLLFEPNDATTAGLAQHLVRQAIARFEPRIKLQHVEADNATPGRLRIRIEYRVRNTGAVHQLLHSIELS